MRKVFLVILPRPRLLREPFLYESRFWKAQLRRRRATGRDHSWPTSERGPAVFDWPEAPLTLLHLGGVLSRTACDVAFLDCASRPKPNELPPGWAEAIDPTDCPILLFSPLTANYDDGLAIARTVKAYCHQAVLIAGGPHVSARPLAAVEDGFDAVVAGFGEEPLRALAASSFDRASWDSVTGLISGRERTFTSRKANWPLPDASLFGLPPYHQLPDRFRANYYARLFTSHGCPYACPFCSGTLWSARTPVKKTLKAIEQELNLIERNIDFKELYVGDEIFTLDTDRALAVAELLGDRGLAWGCETRCDLLNEKLAVSIQDRGCVEIDLGAESFAPSVLARSGKRLSVEAIDTAVRTAGNAGLRVHLNLMLGLPGETRETAKTTLEHATALLHEGAVNTVDYFITVPYPGTPMFESPAKFDLRIRHMDWERYREDDLPVFDYEQLTAEEMFEIWKEGICHLTEAMESDGLE